jgi:hypothetical protein
MGMYRFKVKVKYMDTVKELKDSCFREFSVDTTLYRDCDRFFQKRIRDNNSGKTKYFINAYVYDFKKYNVLHGQIRTTVEVDFYTDKDQNIQISLSAEDFKSVIDLEDYIEKIFVRNGFVPDIHNN